MGDKMTPMSFEQLLTWIMKEHETKGTVFGMHRCFVSHQTAGTLFGRPLETPVGPAAGPHTQLTQNIVAAYYGGSRFFELKTVQILDGEDLPVSKPCIRADDECYNVEWSTELYVPQALEEYIKAWFLLHVLAKEFKLGKADGFQFNMSVGYDLAGIQTEKIDSFIEALKNAEHTQIFQSCKAYLLEHCDMFKELTKEDIEQISPEICNSATLSTLHGCPPQEIERIADYLLTKKGLNTFIKCNPTLLGYGFARERLDQMGYDYIAFGDFHFKDDLQYEDAIPMLKRLMALANEKQLSFGVKLTNTFPVDIKQGELPGEEMYMSGKSLYPLSIALAARLSEEFEGKLRISYSGGADYYNIAQIVGAGIWPVTIATTLLKPGGYERLTQITEEAVKAMPEQGTIDVEAVKELADNAACDTRHIKAVKPLPSRKIKDMVPLTDCFMAPCQSGCPIHQDITDYMQLTMDGNYEEALRVIYEKNPLPFITGTICAHNCMSKCTRNFYEDPVYIRNMKLIAAKGGYEALKNNVKKAVIKSKEKAAVVGGGSAGMAAAYFLQRAGIQTTIFEQTDSLGGVVKHVIPQFRIEDESIANDAAMIEAIGVQVLCNTKVGSIEKLRSEGYTYIIIAVGASKPGNLTLKGKETRNALSFLAEFKESKGHLDIGERVVVIGGGNTAMDTVRAAMRTDGVKEAILLYRRTKRYMPADEEELKMAVEDGVVFKELLSPVEWTQGELLCDVMKLGELDASGRREVLATGEQTSVMADTVIAATGEQVPLEFLKDLGIAINSRGKADINEQTVESSIKNVYVTGDCLYGPKTVVEAIADARRAADDILKKEALGYAEKVPQINKSEKAIYTGRGILSTVCMEKKEETRCLSCAAICENCVEVCPNRANISIKVPGLSMHQIIHVDYMCNECGNCRSFCPYDSAPYLHKFTLFAGEADMKQSDNQGFTVLDIEKQLCKVRFQGALYDCDLNNDSQLPSELIQMMKAVCEDATYLLKQ